MNTLSGMTLFSMETLENISLRQWFIYGVMLGTVAYALLRTAGNLREMCCMLRPGLRRREYHAVRVWGTSPGVLRVFLAAECLIVNALCVLVILVLSDVTLR